MAGIDADGTVVESKPSTLGIAQTLVGPINPREILRLEMEAVDLLSPEATDSPLLTSLKSGTVYRVPFSYTASLEVEPAYLIANDKRVFLLVGRSAEIPWA